MRTAVGSKTLLGLTFGVYGLLSAGMAQAVNVTGFVEADSRYLAYGVDQSAGRTASLWGDVNVHLFQGFGVEGYARQVAAGTREDVSAYVGHKFGGLKVDGILGHAHYDIGSNKSDKNYSKLRAEYAGVYGLWEHDIGTETTKPDTDYYTVGYEHAFTPRLKLGVEATEKRYRAEGISKFNDVALNASYKLTPRLIAVATVAKGGQNDKDLDNPGTSNVGLRYTF